MHQKPDLAEAAIRDFLHEHYDLRAVELVFLPRGGDANAAVYRVAAADGRPFFLKLSSGAFDETSVMVPHFLSERGIRQIIAPFASKSGLPWTTLEDFHAILYPFVEGHNGFETPLAAHQWAEFGAAMRVIHTAILTPALRSRLQQETFSPAWRERVRRLLERVKTDSFDEPIAAQYAARVAERVDEILTIVQKAGQLSAALQAQEPEFVLCHSDIHAGNLLIDAVGSLYILDWDHPILAPKERDLMFIGGGVGNAWYRPEEADWFYAGYNRAGYGQADGHPPEVDRLALAYYRFERIVQDIAEWGELVLLTRTGGEDRARALRGFQRWFSPHDVVAMAYQAEATLMRQAKR